MTIKRRNFLLFLGLGAGSTLVSQIKPSFSRPFLAQNETTGENILTKISGDMTFKPVKLPLPLDIEQISDQQQQDQYRTYEVIDDLVLPEGYTYDLICTWGDRIGDSRCGYNNDYLSFVETAPNQGYLTINFEYISGKTWSETFEKVIGKTLPFAAVKAIADKQEGKINAFALSDNDPLKAQIKAISQECLTDLGIGIISLRRGANGPWERTYSEADRRITGLSGLEDGKYLKATGPALAIFEKANKQGYDDQLGSRIIGTFQNCAGGTTPWGTVLSAEENYQDQVPEPVRADGSSLNPSERPFLYNNLDIDGHANVFGLAGNKYGWMVEIDPTNPQDNGTKHTWLGRYRHEAVGFQAVQGKPLAVYSGCDRRGGHLYKFVSKEVIKNLKEKANSRLMEEGMLYGAKFNADGTGKWIPLTLNTPIDPVLPSQVEGEIVPLPNPNRQEGGMIKVSKDQDITAYKAQFQTLGQLYQGNDQEKQGAILIDAHFAANAAGITCTARPEDTKVSADGILYIAFTSGSPGGDGGPDKAIFRGPNQESPYEFGWIMKLQEDNNEPDALTFRWQMFAAGGEAATGGLGFSNPDNLAIDRNGDVWMVTDIATDKHNLAVLDRNQDDLRGVFGNNTAWFIPTSGPNAGNAYPFAIAPMETEICGLEFTADEKTLFLAIQHPGESGGIRQNMANENRKISLLTTEGTEFVQERKVPIGSNWPTKTVNQAPCPAVVAVRAFKS